MVTKQLMELPHPALGYPKGFKYMGIVKYTYDFEFLKKRVQTILETLSGSPILQDLDAVKYLEEWDCKLHSKEE